MAKNTNFQNLKALLEVYEPATQGFVSEEEFELIEEQLELKDMEIIDLRNLRDFTVMYLSHNSEAKENPLMGSLMQTMDKMSAITAVIDQTIINKGGEV